LFAVALVAEIRTSTALAQGRLTQIIAFGDSYSDNGVKLHLSTQAVAAGMPHAVVKPDPKLYVDGRYSNGPVAIEVLAHNLNLTLTDYAVGGAMSGDQNYDSWLDDYTATGMQAQIASFQHDLNGAQADPNALYYVEISANDYFKFIDFAQPGVLFVGSTTTASMEEMADRAAENTGLAVSRLMALGARRFLVVKSLFLQGLPYILASGQSQIAEAFARRYNDKLQEALARLDQPRGSSARFFDWGRKTQDIIAHAAHYGLTNTTDACEVTFPVPQDPCASPDTYLFWDEYHPTRRYHQIIASMLEQLVEEN
jgi:phospholipase/lecithinase/hemolysin